MRRISALAAVLSLGTAAACTSSPPPPLAEPANWCELTAMEGTATDQQLFEFTQDAPSGVEEAAEMIALAIAIERLDDEPEPLPEGRVSIGELFDLPETAAELAEITPSEDDLDAARDVIGEHVEDECG